MKKPILFLLLALLAVLCAWGANAFITERWPKNYHYNYFKAICGIRTAQYRTARSLYFRGEYERCYRWLALAANLGEPTSQYQMGYAYETADQVERDILQALYWYEKSAEQDYPPALYRMGVLYQIGKYVPRNDEKGMELIRKAADLGHEEAIERLEKIETEEKMWQQELQEMQEQLRQQQQQQQQLRDQRPRLQLQYNTFNS
jgi:TPR repeat protein